MKKLKKIGKVDVSGYTATNYLAEASSEDVNLAYNILYGPSDSIAIQGKRKFVAEYIERFGRSFDEILNLNS